MSSILETNEVLKDIEAEQTQSCCSNPKNMIAIEYSYGHPYRYDGVSELKCKVCKTRTGRWSGKVLKDGEFEPRYGGDQVGK